MKENIKEKEPALTSIKRDAEKDLYSRDIPADDDSVDDDDDKDYYGDLKDEGKSQWKPKTLFFIFGNSYVSGRWVFHGLQFPDGKTGTRVYLSTNIVAMRGYWTNLF